MNIIYILISLKYLHLLNYIITFFIKKQQSLCNISAKGASSN